MKLQKEGRPKTIISEAYFLPIGLVEISMVNGGWIYVITFKAMNV